MGTQRNIKMLCVLCGLKIIQIIYFNSHALPAAAPYPTPRSAHQHTPALPSTGGAAVCGASGRQGSEAKSGGGNYSKITADARRTKANAKCFTAKSAKFAKTL